MRKPRPSPPCDETALLDALRAGDDAAFTALVRRWHSPMVGVALRHVRGRALAEDVVQETWLGVLRGLPAFEGRSTLRTWVFSILVNRAKTRGIREHRSIPFSAFSEADLERGAIGARAPVAPSAEAQVLQRESAHELRRAIDGLPPVHRAVVALRELEGRPSEEVAGALGLTRANERVLVHRAHHRLRLALGAPAGGRLAA